MTTIHLDPNMVPAALRRAYSGKKFSAEVCEQMTVPADAGLWDGGSRDTYSGIELTTGQTADVIDRNASPWDRSRKDVHVQLKPGFAVVRHAIYRGADLGLHFYVHPDNAAQLLPAPTEPLPVYERLILTATKRFKSSYGGQDRYQMAQRDYDCERLLNGFPYPSREQWEFYKQVLIGKGLLNKAGAITVAGRNAVPR